jgi:hypothetical protein
MYCLAKSLHEASFTPEVEPDGTPALNVTVIIAMAPGARVVEDGDAPVQVIVPHPVQVTDAVVVEVPAP